MDEDKAKVVPVMTTHERQEMLNPGAGELPRTSTRLHRPVLPLPAGTPARGPAASRDMLNALFRLLGSSVADGDLTDTEREPEAR